MSGVVDWGSYMLSKDRLSKDFDFKTGIPKLSLKRSLNNTGEDMDRLFMGAPVEEEPIPHERTLVAVEGRPAERSAGAQPDTRRRRSRATAFGEPTGRRTVLGE